MRTHSSPLHKPLVAALYGLILFFSLCLPPSPALAAMPSLPDPDRITYKPFSFTPPKADRVSLDNGLVLYSLENRELPLINLTAVIKTGSMFDPPAKEGLAEMTGKNMRTGGIEGMSGNAVDETLESMAAALHVSVNRDSVSFSLSLLSKDLEKGLDIFSRVLMKPMFEEEKLLLSKELKIEELRRISDDPQKLAFREFGRIIHEGSPRGRLVTINSINQIRQDDLIRFHDRFYHPERVLMSVSGDIGKGEAKEIISRYFGSWKPSGEKIETPSVPRSQEARLFFIPKEGPQSIVIFGWPAPTKKETAFFPMEVSDFIVGSGGFRSRIFQEIRTDRGLAYSAGSFYTAKSEYGYFGAYTMTKSESTAEVISLLRRIMSDFIKKPLLPDELERTKSSILNSFIFSFTSADQIALQQMMIEYDDLPEDYLVTYRNKIEVVDKEDVRKTAARYLDPEKAIILITGNDAVFKELSALYKNISVIERP
jgi:zinc protease